VSARWPEALLADFEERRAQVTVLELATDETADDFTSEQGQSLGVIFRLEG
jgi:hypothetical protein